MKTKGLRHLEQERRNGSGRQGRVWTEAGLPSGLPKTTMTDARPRPRFPPALRSSQDPFRSRPAGLICTPRTRTFVFAPTKVRLESRNPATSGGRLHAGPAPRRSGFSASGHSPQGLKIGPGGRGRAGFLGRPPGESPGTPVPSAQTPLADGTGPGLERSGRKVLETRDLGLGVRGLGWDLGVGGTLAPGG